MLSILRIKWSVNYSTYLMDHLICKAPSDFRQRFPPSPTTLEQKKVKFTGLTSTVDARRSSSKKKLEEEDAGSFLAPPPHLLNEEEEEPQRRRRKKKAQEEEAGRRSRKKKKCDEAGRWGRWRSRKKEERADPKEEEGKRKCREGEREVTFFLKINEGHFCLFTLITGCTSKTAGCT